MTCSKAAAVHWEELWPGHQEAICGSESKGLAPSSLRFVAGFPLDGRCGGLIHSFGLVFTFVPLDFFSWQATLLYDTPKQSTSLQRKVIKTWISIGFVLATSLIVIINAGLIKSNQGLFLLREEGIVYSSKKGTVAGACCSWSHLLFVVRKQRVVLCTQPVHPLFSTEPRSMEWCCPHSYCYQPFMVVEYK